MNSANPYIKILLLEFHSTRIGGHLGVTKTLHRLQFNFYWEHMHCHVQQFVWQCHTCQQVKHVSWRPTNLLQPLLIPSVIWEDLSLDFVTHLPSSQSFTVILVVVDRFSKGVHLGTLPPAFTAFKVATSFLDISYKLHGFPGSLVSDRDPIFIGAFWRELFKLSRTTLRMSTAYHPQTDGQTKVMNKVIEQYLHSFVHTWPKDWHKFLSLV